MAARNALETERSVIGLVTDQHHRRRAGLRRRLERDRHQLAADADILEGGPHRKRPEHQRAAGTRGDAGHAHRGDDEVAIDGDEGQRALVRRRLRGSCRRRGQNGPARRLRR